MLRGGTNFANYDIHIKNTFKPKSEKLQMQIHPQGYIGHIHIKKNTFEYSGTLYVQP